MQNLGNVYICVPHLLWAETDTQNGLDMIFTYSKFTYYLPPPQAFQKNKIGAYKWTYYM
jgi:hypothetical protein